MEVQQRCPLNPRSQWRAAKEILPRTCWWRHLEGLAPTAVSLRRVDALCGAPAFVSLPKGPRLKAASYFASTYTYIHIQVHIHI